MHEVVKNLRHKNYNPCGGLTGFECELCDAATKNFPNLPFTEVMRAVSVNVLAKLEQEKNFPNEAALINWASYNLSDVEQRANLNFDTFTPLDVGLAKYLVHVLYENRYNIHYNALVDFCRDFDEWRVVAGLTSDELESKINSFAQDADYSSSVNHLAEKILPVIGGAQYSVVSDVVTTLLSFI